MKTKNDLDLIPLEKKKEIYLAIPVHEAWRASKMAAASMAAAELRRNVRRERSVAASNENRSTRKCVNSTHGTSIDGFRR